MTIVAAIGVLMIVTLLTSSRVFSSTGKMGIQT